MSDLIGCLCCSFSLVVLIPGSLAQRWVHPERNTHAVIVQNYAQFHRRNSYAVSLRDPNNRKVPIQEHNHYRIYDNKNPQSVSSDQHPAARVRVTIHKNYPQSRATVPRDEPSSSPHHYHQQHHRRRRQHHSNHHPHYDHRDNRDENRPAIYRDENRPAIYRDENRPAVYRDDNRSRKDHRVIRHGSDPPNHDENESRRGHPDDRHVNYLPNHHNDHQSRKDHRDNRNENRPAVHRGENRPEVHRDDNRPAVHHDESRKAIHRDEYRPANHRDENRPANHRDENRPPNHRDENRPPNHRDENRPAVHRDENRPAIHHDDNRSRNDHRVIRHGSHPPHHDENQSRRGHPDDRHVNYLPNHHDDQQSRKDHRDNRDENRPPIVPPEPPNPRRKCEPIPYNCLMQKHLHDKRVSLPGRPDCKIEKTWKALGCPQIIEDLISRGKKLCHKKPFYFLLLPKTGNGYPTQTTPAPQTSRRPYWPDRRTHPTTPRPYWTGTRTHPTDIRRNPTTPRPYVTDVRTHPTTSRPYVTDVRTHPTTSRPYRTYPKQHPTSPTTPTTYYTDPTTHPTTPRPYDYRTRPYWEDPRNRPSTSRPYWSTPTTHPPRSTERLSPGTQASWTRPYWEDPRNRPSTPRPYWEDARNRPSTPRPYWEDPRTRSTSYTTQWTAYRPRRPTYQPLRPTETELPVETRPRPSPTTETTTVATTTTTRATTTTSTTTVKPFTFCSAPQRPKNGLVVCYDDQIVAVENSVLPGQNGVEKRVVYPTGTICKYFCLSGYELSTSNPNEGVIICEDSSWNHTAIVECLYNYCPKSPDIANAVMSCTDKKSNPGAPRRSDISVEESYSTNGLYRSDSSVCTYKCKTGFQMIIPDRRGALTKSKIVPSWTIACKPPQWNITEAIPKCLEKMNPILNCQDAITVVKGQWRDNVFDTPTAASGDQTGRRLKVICSSKVKGKKLGLRVVICNTEDPFYGTSASCKFNVNVIGQCLSPPVAPENGSITCDLSEDYGPDVGSILHSVGSFCHYSCDSGHVIPTSQSQLDTITCSDGLKWNLTKVPLCVQQLPPVAKVCDNVPKNSTDPELFVAPDYVSTFNNQRLNSSCVVTNEAGDVVATFKDQMKLSLLGLFVITCSTYDPELRISAQCNYSMKAVDVELPLDELTTLSSSAFSDASFDERDMIQLDEECPVLMSPANGDIECYMESSNCVVTCNKDHTLHSPAFKGTPRSSLTVECFKEEGRWNFMPTKDSPAKLPDCLRELPTTSLEVVLGFNVSLRDGCGSNEPFINRTVQVLVAANRGSCATINCKDWITQCWQNEKGSVLTFKWIVKASFDPKDYDSNAEDTIDDVIKQTKKSVISGDDFRNMVEAEGHSIEDNSFTQSHFRLVCDKPGFGVDKATDQCVECPSGTYHDGGEECVACEFGTYQDGTGATECKPCTSTSSAQGSSGARTKSEC